MKDELLPTPMGNTLVYSPDAPKVGKVHEIKNIIGCTPHSRNSTIPYSLSNCWTSGFNLVGSEAKVDLLKWNGYSVAIFNQSDVEMDDSNRLKRELVTVARHQLDSHVATELTKRIVTVYLQCFKTNNELEQIELLSGVSYFDLETGENGISEMYSRKDDPLKCLQDLYRYLIGVRPKEIYIHIKNIPEIKQAAYTDFIARYLELYNFPFARCIYDQVPTNYLKVGFQNTMLGDLFFPSTRDTTLGASQQFNFTPSPNIVATSPFFTPTASTSSSTPFILPTSLTNMSIQMPDGSLFTTVVSFNDAISRLGLESFPNGVVSYLLLLDYCKDFNSDLWVSIQKPKVTWMDADTTLILTHNAISQLDIFGSNNSGPNNGSHSHLESSKPLIEIIDKTSTPMGKRFLHSRLISPLTSAAELNSCYDMTESLMANAGVLKEIGNALRQVGDLSKLKRSLSTSKIPPKGLATILQSCLQITNIYNKIQTAQMTPLLKKAPTESLNLMSRALNYIISNISVDLLTRCETSFLHETRSDKALILPSDIVGSTSILATPSTPSSDFYRSFTIYESNIRTLKERLDALIATLNEMSANVKTRGKSSENGIKLNAKSNKNKRGYTEEIEIVVKPKSRATALEKAFANVTIEQSPLLVGATFIHRSSGSILTSPTLESTITLLQEQMVAYFRQLYALYTHLIEVLTKDKFLDSIIDFVVELDFVCSNARNAIENKYYRPEIVDEGGGSNKYYRPEIVGGSKVNSNSNGEEGYVSFLEMREGRHPIVERQRVKKFIPNDISLGKGIASRNLGDGSRTLGSPYCACIRGPNTAGKTTLTKTVALMILLAQSGYFVPARLVYRPYSRIITRLSGNDNLRQGLSSYQVEVIELRIILKNADNRTLVLGDELCRGTEIVSAISMTIGAILELTRRQCSFIFSTHLYDLNTYPDIAKLKAEDFVFYHLTSHYDKTTGLLIQDRLLKEGMGPLQYGVAVARAQGLPSNFMDSVERISRDMGKDKEGEGSRCSSSSISSSRYHPYLPLDKCSVCGSTENLETHHREEQMLADGKGYIGTMHKNTLSNLDVLCHGCHLNITRGKSRVQRESVGDINIVRCETVV
jgi:DNA mismatch repair protein MutS